MSIDSRAFRDAMGSFATGICIATTCTPDGQKLGVTVNSFTSLSLDPPLVLFCLIRGSRSLPAFLAATGFAVTILAEEQQALSNSFARSPDGDRWDGVTYETWESGAPVIFGGVAAIDCAREAVHEGGDHLILIGRVLRLATNPDARPLLYARGRYARLAD